MLGAKVTTMGFSSPILTTAGPGHTPLRPHPTPNSEAPTKSFQSKTLFSFALNPIFNGEEGDDLPKLRVGFRNTPTFHRLSSSNETAVTATPAPSTAAKEGSHPADPEKSRKPSTRRGSLLRIEGKADVQQKQYDYTAASANHMPLMPRPSPKSNPLAKEAMCSLTVTPEDCGLSTRLFVEPKYAHEKKLTNAAAVKWLILFPASVSAYSYGT